MARFLSKKTAYKKAICYVLALALLLVSVFSVVTSTFGQSVTTDIAPTRLGTSNTFYSYDADTKTLTISGEGECPNFTSNGETIPWNEWTDDTIESIVVEQGITKIGDYMFYSKAAQNVNLPMSLRIIGNYAFSFNNKLTSVVVPFGVEELGQSAFASCYYLENISFPNTLKAIGQRTFYNCQSLDNIVIPASVKTINNYAFYRCSALTNFSFQSLTQTVNLEKYVFYGCPNLKELVCPLNLSLNIKAFGYADTKNKYDDVLMRVFRDSDAYNYAAGNLIPFEFLDEIPMENGVNYDNTFTQDNVDSVYHYTYVPKTSEVYNFYSTGTCDLVGKLYENGALVGEADDIAQDNLNFCISYSLVAGHTYDLYVSAYRNTGDYSVYVLPDNITGLSVLKGSVSADVNDSSVVKGNRIFNFGSDKFSNFVLRVNFGNGNEFVTNYQPYIAGYYVVSGDDQVANPYSCGDSLATISLKGNTASYDLFIEHSYDETIIAPTVDENGYTKHTCVICGDSYNDNEVEPSSYVVTGKCVLAENIYGKHEQNMPFSHATIKVGTRTYSINSDGTWKIRTYNNCYAVFQNEFGSNVTIYIDVDNNGGSYSFGTVVLEGYDLNKDGYVNAKDYVIYRKTMYNELGANYWDFGKEFLIKHR